MKKKPIQKDEPSPEEINQGPMLGQILHSELNWGAGREPSAGTDQFFAGGTGRSAGEKFEPTAEDIARFIEMSHDRFGGK